MMSHSYINAQLKSELILGIVAHREKDHWEPKEHHKKWWS